MTPYIPPRILIQSQVMRGYWYMGKFGGPSPKRHVAWSNDEAFVQELLARGGFMSITERNALGTTKLVKRGHKNGVPTFTGCKKLLKNSQSPDCSHYSKNCRAVMLA